MLCVVFLYLPFAKILRILSLPLPILGEAHCHGHRIAFKQTKEKNRQSYLYPGGRPWAAYPFPTRLLPIEYFPLPPRNISRCHQGIFPTATTEYFPLLPRNISHCHQEKLYIFVTEPGFLPISYSPDLASICYLGCK